jgi:hypothetical protein
VQILSYICSRQNWDGVFEGPIYSACMSILTGLLDPETKMPRHRTFWWVLGGVILAQLVALGMLCRHQVAVAQTRHAEQHMHRVALADCLQHIPGATLSACNGRVPRDDREPVYLHREATIVTASATVPVIYAR